LCGQGVPADVQIVGYLPTGSESGPALLVADEGTVHRERLDPGRELSFALGDRHCAGVRQGDQHDPCDAPGAPYCETHTVPWSVANNADSEEEHAVYLAAFAPDVFKVGVTRTWRLETRLREQGADWAAHVYTVPDGRVARDVEADVAADVPDRVRVPTKVRGLHRDVDESAWHDLLADFDVLERFDFDYGLDLDAQPVPETLASGSVLGVKGRVLVLERAGTAYGVDMRDLVGYEVSEGGYDRDAQASLGAFG
jgi:hypothetical protein